VRISLLAASDSGDQGILQFWGVGHLYWPEVPIGCDDERLVVTVLVAGADVELNLMEDVTYYCNDGA
jgi:hypothetical protein